MQHVRNSLRLRLLRALHASLATNDASLPNSAARYRRGQRLSTAVVESRVNRVIGRRMAKKPPMRWSRRGAYRWVQIRVAVLSGERLPPPFQRR